MKKNNTTKLYSSINTEVDFVMTGDGSVGLYNNQIGDIYHSSYGALSEAREKFIRPLNFSKNFHQKLSKNKTIKVLDICSGIGYNTKAFLDYVAKLPDSSRTKISIDALEYNKQLVLISPFIKDGIKDSYLSYFLLNELQDDIHENFDLIKEIILNPQNRPFLSRPIINLLKKYQFREYNYDPQERFLSSLHNIYYQYVSCRNKRRLSGSRIGDYSFSPHYVDARNYVKSSDSRYDIVFLDAFTPLKLPTLWSEEFFVALYNLMNDDSLLVTYSNSAAVRNAMLKAGFFVGKTFDLQKRPSGTIASKNKNFIEFPLDEFDFGLMMTNAGVTFNDPNLDWSPEKILDEYNTKKLRLQLPSSSSFIKTHKRKEDSSCMTL